MKWLPLEFDDGRTVDVTTPTGWTAFKSWVRSLPRRRYPYLAEFAQECATTEGVALVEELRTAILHRPPQPAKVFKTALKILAGLKTAPRSEWIYLTHGDTTVL